METQIQSKPDPLLMPPLTAKQKEVMALVADNRTSKEIAALLGISESAVNQRIEMIRARLGGLPRGEMARLYRQKLAQEETIAENFPPTWKKIQVQPDMDSGQINNVEGPSGAASHWEAPKAGTGSQPSRPLLPVWLAWLGREEPLAVLIRAAAVAGLVFAGMTLAAAITQWMGFNASS